MNSSINIYKLSSPIFLVLQLAYTTLLLSSDPGEYFIIKLAVIILVFIFSIWYSLKNSNNIVSYLLVFLCVNVALIGKNPNDILNFLLIIGPLLSSFSILNNRNLLFIVSLPFLTYFIHLIINLSKINIELNEVIGCLVCLSFISVISFINSEKNNLRRHLDLLESEINDFYTSKYNRKQPYKIYFPIKDLISKELQNFVFSRISSNKSSISNIHCYTISEGSIVLVNGTKFLWENSIGNKGLIQDLTKSHGVLYDYPINYEPDSNIIFKVECNSYEYIFVIKLNGHLNYLYQKFNFFTIYKPIFQKISDLLNNEKQLFSIRRREISDLSDKRKYVNYAIKSMHFIRNRLTPFDNLTELLSYYFSHKFNNEKEKRDALGFIKSESVNCKKELHHLVTRANYILENNRNPFGYLLTEKATIIDIYASVNRNFGYYFPGKFIEAKFEKIINNNTYKNYYVEINKEGFEIFISDWLNNCKKYSKNYIKCELDLTDELIILKFANNYNLKEQDIKSLVKDLNSDSKREILKRSTNGVFLIKEFLEGMDIEHSAKIESVFYENAPMNVLVFSIAIKLIPNENSNI